jgi:hypothetical protein
MKSYQSWMLLIFREALHQKRTIINNQQSLSFSKLTLH